MTHLPYFFNPILVNNKWATVTCVSTRRPFDTLNELNHL